ncbi:MAG: response regulator, partial [Hyphomicrobium sp.]
MTAKPSSVPLHRILLAEDDDSMRGFLVKALQKANYDVV